MALPTLIRRLLYPTPGEGKAYTTGVTFVGPDTSAITYLRDRLLHRDAELTRSTAFAVSAYCYTAMRWRAERMAQAPLMVVRENADGVEWQPAHPLAGFLAQPRPDIQMGEILERTQLYRDLTGAALWVTDSDVVGRRRLITPYTADEFRTFADPPRIYGRYEVLTPGGAWREVDLEAVVHFRDVNPASWREPLSKVDVALLQLDLGNNVARIVHAFLRKAIMPGGVISADAKWSPTPEEWRTWKSQVEAWYTGPGRQGAPLIVPGGTTVETSSSAVSDLMPEEILDRIEATVGAVFGTPPVVLGWLSGMKNSPWSQMSEARRQVYEDTIEPLWQDYERRLTMAYLTPEEQARGLLIRFDTSRVRALQTDREQEARVGALAADALTVNERRVRLGEDPLPEEDERGEIIVGLQSFGADIAPEIGSGREPDTTTPAPAGDTEAAAAAGNAAGTALNGAQVAALVDIVTQVTAGTLPPSSAEAIIAASFPLLTAEQVAAIMADVDAIPAPAPEEDDTEDEPPPDFGKGGMADTKDLLWLLFDSSTKAAEGTWSRVVYAHLQDLRRQLVKLAERTLATAKADEVPSPESVRKFRAAAERLIDGSYPKLVTKTYPLIVSTGTSAVRRLASRVGVSFDVLQPGLLKYAREESAFLAKVMGKTTGEKVAKAVQDALNAGDTLRGMILRLEELPAFDRARAKLTARTETTRAWNGAQRRSLSEYSRTSGRKATKTWLSARDARVRDEHVALDDGKAIAIDATFANGLTEPGEPNCRCTLLYGFDDPPPAKD